MNLDPIKQAVRWLEDENALEDEDCGDPKCRECDPRRARQKLIDMLKLLHDSLSMASQENAYDALKKQRDALLEALETVEWYGAGSGWIVDAEKVAAAIEMVKGSKP